MQREKVAFLLQLEYFCFDNFKEIQLSSRYIKIGFPINIVYCYLIDRNQLENSTKKKQPKKTR